MTILKNQMPLAPKGKADGKPKTIMLADVCKKMKIQPREARMLLRLAISKKGEYPALAEERVSRQPWQWVDGSKALEEAKKALTVRRDENI